MWHIEVDNPDNVFATLYSDFYKGDKVMDEMTKVSAQYPDLTVKLSTFARFRVFMVNGVVVKSFKYANTYTVEDRDDYISGIIFNEMINISEDDEYWNQFSDEQLIERYKLTA